jgi:hypothetical protein
MQSQNIIVNEFNFDQLVDFCFDQIFQWGKEDPTVVRRLIQTLTLLAGNTENPFNLMVLIREVQDMDIPAIYNTQNVAVKGIRISAEKMEGVLKELQDFKVTAKRKITLLKEKGFLEYQPVEDPTPIELKEKEAIEYLLEFGVELKSNK